MKGTEWNMLKKHEVTGETKTIAFRIKKTLYILSYNQGRHKWWIWEKIWSVLKGRGRKTKQVQPKWRRQNSLIFL